MNIRKERTHLCGLSNVDYKTRKDTEAYQTYNEDFRSTNFGTMGRIAVKKLSKPADKQASLQVTSGFQLPQQPNSKSGTSINYYSKAGKKLQSPQQIRSQLDSHLESTKFNGVPFTGEDVRMKTWYEGKQKIASNEETTSQPYSEKGADIKQLQFKGDKIEKNEKAITETQLVKITNKSTLEGKVDIENVKGIRRAIRRRYGNRTNFRKLFNTWDKTSKGYIDAADTYNMVSKLGIKINQVEAAVLLGSVDKKHQGKIGMDEFMSLIFGAEESLNVNFKKLKFNNEEELIQNTQGLADAMQVATDKLKRAEEYNEIKQLLKRKLPDMIGDVKYGKKERSMDYDTFKSEIIEKGGLPEKYNGDQYLQHLFNDNGNRTNRIDFVSFLDSIRNYSYAEKTDNELGSPIRPKKMLPQGVAANTANYDHLFITGQFKMPINKLDGLIEKAKKVTHIIQNKYQNQSEFQSMMSQKFTNQRAAQHEIEGFLIEEFKPNLLKREITRDDITSFLYALPCDNQHFSNIESVMSNAYAYIVTQERCGNIKEIL